MPTRPAVPATQLQAVQAVRDGTLWSRPGVWLAFAALLGLYLVLAMPVFAQESYYWMYSRNPALSYFDHPPMVAWLIWLATRVFGDGVLGIRAATLACAVGATYIGLRLLRELGGDRPLQRAWIVLSVGVPLLAASHFLANPDPPLACAYGLVMFAIWRVRSGGGIGWWMVAGLAAGIALLSKYTAAFLAVSGAAAILLDPVLRRELRKPGVYVGVVIAALTFAPVVIWNWQHDFASFRFQTENRYEHGHLGLRLLGDFVLGQIGVFHPVLFVALVWAMPWLVREAWRGDMRLRFLLCFGLPLPLFFACNSLWVQVKLNWLLPAYAPLLLALLLWSRESGVALRCARLSRFVPRAIVVAVGLTLVAPLIRLVPQHGGSSWTGWEEIAWRAEEWETKIDHEDGIEGNVFFFASGYRDAAQLLRNLTVLAPAFREEDPGEVVEPTLASNVFGQRALEFDYTERADKHVGNDAIFVLPRPNVRPDEVMRAHACFHSVEKVDSIRIVRLGITVLTADFYVCRGYRGPGRGTH